MRLCFIAGIVLLCTSCLQPDRIQRSRQSILIFHADSTLTPNLEELTQQAPREIVFFSTQDLAYLEEDSLLKHSSLMLINIRGETLSPRSQSLIERYVQTGNGLICLNTSNSYAYAWPWLDSLLIQKASSNQVGSNGLNPPQKEGWIANAYDGGRIVSHSIEGNSLPNSEWKSILREMMIYAVGTNTYRPGAVKSPLAPTDNRFTRVILDDYDVNEPMELAVLTGGRILFIERRGKMKLYSPTVNYSKTIATFEVCTEGNYEDGLLGLAADPNFAENHYIYLYYSPPCDIWEQYLSRFTMIGDSINLASEKILLKVPVQRETCCHSGGSVSFGPDGNLYLSTGDNTSSKESNGYTPTDIRPGRGPFDAQKSSGNTHDLRGKILRIKPNGNGSYDIPPGNLFPRDGSKGRPEIYAMGARNPFRISIDAKTGFVYWGDVGPDAARDGFYGPESMDEWNQAREPGNFGWPYFVGNNTPYPYRDFEMDTIGALYDPQNPQNFSPNNTGSNNLPPAKGAFIWYPKRKSEFFPMLGQGSNSAMAGPIYYPPVSATQSGLTLPDYYHGKMFIYEWARSWIQLLTMNAQGDLIKIEPFLPDVNFAKPIEMEIGPDGAIYMLEYGHFYFMNNPLARLSRIEFAAGNRMPTAIIQTDQDHGAIPLTVHFSAALSTDPDEGDHLRFEWHFTDSLQVQAEGSEADFTFESPGRYSVLLKAIDQGGEESVARKVLTVGNQPPAIELSLSGNQDFFFDTDQRGYKVEIADPEDAAAGGINPEKTRIQFVYIEDGQDLQLMLGRGEEIKGSMRYLKGLNLIKSSDCWSCHSDYKSSVGPAYIQVAERYSPSLEHINSLAEKVFMGGNGNWGEKIMPGHPQHSLEECQEMVRYILNLSDPEKERIRNLNGTLAMDQHRSGDQQGAYLLAASYTDRGADPIPSLSSREQHILRAPYLKADRMDEGHKTGRRMDGNKKTRENPVVSNIRHGAYLKFADIDLTDVTQLRFMLKSQDGGQIELRANTPDGQRLGLLSLTAAPNKEQAPWVEKVMKIQAKSDRIDFYLVCLNEARADSGDLLWLDWIKFESE